MPRRVRATGPIPPMSRPLNRTRPSVGGSAPVSTLMRVDLPAPLGPMIETNSFSRMVRLIPSRAT